MLSLARHKRERWGAWVGDCSIRQWTRMHATSCDMTKCLCRARQRCVRSNHRLPHRETSHIGPPRPSRLAALLALAIAAAPPPPGRQSLPNRQPLPARGHRRRCTRLPPAARLQAVEPTAACSEPAAKASALPLLGCAPLHRRRRRRLWRRSAGRRALLPPLTILPLAAFRTLLLQR